jgi:hypothetical protein
MSLGRSIGVHRNLKAPTLRSQPFPADPEDLGGAGAISPGGIDPKNTISGYHVDVNNVYHGFQRLGCGGPTEFGWRRNDSCRERS